MTAPNMTITEENIRKYDKTVTFCKSNYGSGPHRALVFIHGGAWIDDKNTPFDFYELSEKITEEKGRHLDFSMYAIDYRLSPAVKHPLHMYDVIENLYQLITTEKIDELHILGHSVGATLAWQILSWSSDSPCTKDFNKNYNVQFIRSKLSSCYLADGIYSLKELLDEYPDYTYFVSQAFKDIEEFDDPACSTILIPPQVRIHIIHSYQDELLTLRQSTFLCGILQGLKQQFFSYFDSLGKHNDVYCSETVAKYVLKTIG